MRNRPKYLVRASAVNSVSSRMGSLLSVLATAGFELPVNQTLAAFGCTHCGTSFSAIADSQPFCVTCGSDEVSLDQDTELPPEALTDDQELSGVICVHCNHNNIFSDVVAAKLGGKLHCITCGEAMEFTPPAVGDELPEVDALAETSETDPDGSMDLPTLEEGMKAGDAPAEDLAPPVDAHGEDTLAAGADEADDADAIDLSLAEVMPEGEPEDFDLAVSTDDDEAACVMVASVKGVPVATLAYADAGQFQEQFGRMSLVRAVKSAVAQVGRDKALANFGFKPIMVKFPVKAQVDKLVTAALQDRSKAVQVAAAELGNDYKQALAIAAAGLHKSFFKGRDNPLKAHLYDELVAAGVRSPAKVVDRVFMNHGAAFLSTLLELAEEVRAKPLDVRNELATTVDSANYLLAEVEDEDGPEVEEQQAGIRIVKPTQTTEVTASVRGQKSPLFGTSRRVN